jgi:MFS transporter, FSR family, fosmidomycin resistance protein
MTEALTRLEAAPAARPSRVVTLVCSAHFVSHVYLITLPPLFVFIRAQYGVSYADLGLLVALFNIVSVVLQTPAGFFVDRSAPALTLVLALVIGGGGMALAGTVPAYWALVLGFIVVGIANPIYHPADYAILSDAVRPNRVGHAFAVHTFVGMVGTAAAPVSLLFLATRFGWHGALWGAALLGFAVAVLLLARRSDIPPVGAQREARAKGGDAGWRLVLSPPILRNLMFFVLLSAAGAGVTNFSIVALAALQGTTLAGGNAALSAFLVMNAVGVLAGGFIATRTRRHDLAAVALLAVNSAAFLGIALLPLGLAAIIALMILAGFVNGAVQPARDMMVRAVTPDGSFGKVFGFVAMGFSIGGMIGPIIYGYLMDRNAPRLVFIVMVAFTALALAFVRAPARETRGR